MNNESDRSIPQISTAATQIPTSMDGAEVRGAVATASTSSAAALVEKKGLKLHDLPIEIQKKICEYSTSADLITLSLVSKHFREIAAHRLYRSFHIVFPDDDDPCNDSTIDGLAGGLDTFVTSDYDYAQHLREIVLDTLSPGNKGELAYRHYLYDARALETFRWDIRVELSRQVFKVLHQTRSLHHLHLRMQDGLSLYQEPPPLPTTSTQVPPPPGPLLPPGPALQNATPFLLPPLPPAIGVGPGSSSSLYPMGGKISQKGHHKPPRLTPPRKSKTPPTISGFTGLKSLSILDMDTYEYVDEVKSCLHNCSSTLTTLRLSFSESLANKSRKPPQEIPSDDDSEEEDEFGQPIPLGPLPPIGGASDPNGHSKALRAQEEKKTQEAVLGKIFGLETATTKPKPPSLPIIFPSKIQRPQDELKQFLIRNLDTVAARLMTRLNPGSDISKEGKELLAMIEKAVKVYKGHEERKEDKAASASSGSETPKATPASSDGGVDVAENDAGVSGVANVTETPGLFDEPKKKKEPKVDSGISNPDDIDIEQPDGEELPFEIDATPGDLSDSIEPADSSTSRSTATIGPNTAPSATIDNTSSIKEVQPLSELDVICAAHELVTKESEDIRELTARITAEVKQFKEKALSEELDAEDLSTLLRIQDEQIKLKQKIFRLCDDVSRQTQAAYKQTESLTAAEKEIENAESGSNEISGMSEYVRNTRGLTLKTLDIYLIPIKASILARAVDLSVLQNITLLNVGPQIPFWNMLLRQNKNSPLAIRKIHTDNVTVPFLAFVSGLGTTLEELYLLERSAKARVESTAAKTTVNIEHIRRAILRKHASTLKVLMIRNDNQGSEWDLDVKTAMLLCRRASQLEELAVSFGTRTMHTILQCFSGLKSLRALHTIQFRTDDTCAWVMREFRKFFIDNISLHPELKLKYLALDSNVERLVRLKPSKVTPSKDKKGKGKEPTSSSGSKTLADLIMDPVVSWSDGSGFGGNNTFNAFGNPSPWGADASTIYPDSSDDEGALGLKNGLKIEAMVGPRFCDIPGVKIFAKEVICGQL